MKMYFCFSLQAKVIDGKKITTTDTGIAFKKLKSPKLGIVDYKKFLEDLAKTKKIELDEIKGKLTNCGLPGHHGIGVCTFLYYLVKISVFYYTILER